jgi:hypothetical protein
MGYGQPPALTGSQQQDARRKVLHEKSKAEVNEWSSTIAGVQRAKLHAKEKRDAEKEALQVKQDLEDAKYVAEQRKQQIRKSKMQMFRQTDMVKAFEASQLLTEVVNERSRQGNFAEDRNTMRAGVEQQRMDRMVADIQAAEREEVEKQERARKAAVSTAKHQLEEAASHRNQRRHDRKAQLEHQAAIDADYIAYIQEQSEKAAAKKAATLKMVADRRQCDDDNRQMKQRVSLLDTVTLEKAAMAKAAQDVMAERLKTETLASRRFEIKKRENMAASLAQVQEDNSAGENERIRVAQEEKWKARDEEEAQKESTRKGVIKECLKHRVEMLAERRTATEEEVFADRQERADIQADTMAAAEYEAKALLEKKRRDRLILGVHAKDIATHKQAVASEFDKLKAEREGQLTQLNWERDTFKRYAARQVDVSKERGDTLVYPLTKAIGDLNRDDQPKPRPNLPSIDVRRVGNPYPHNSKMRMGFTY